jgi:hypothetical protein
VEERRKNRNKIGNKEFLKRKKRQNMGIKRHVCSENSNSSRPNTETNYSFHGK